MASSPRKPLTHTFTDEMAQKLGYPNARLYQMDVRLAELAGQYNETRDPAALKQHQSLYKEMLDMGMTRTMFGADTEILREEFRRK